MLYEVITKVAEVGEDDALVREARHVGIVFAIDLVLVVDEDVSYNFV